MRRYLAPALLIVVVGAPASGGAAPASAAPPVRSCGTGGTTKLGLLAVNVRARTVSCATARSVARRARFSGTEGNTASTRIDGVTWACKTIQAATGTDPGLVARTKVECRRSARSTALVRFELQS